MTNYQDYLKSKHWDRIRRAALKRAGYSCQLCGRQETLDVHHNNYRNLWHEKAKDVFAICRKCHEIHNEAKAKEAVFA